MEFTEPILADQFIKLAHQTVRCTFFSGEGNNVIDRYLNTLCTGLRKKIFELKDINELLDLLLSNFKLASLLANIKGNYYVAQLLLLTLHYYENLPNDLKNDYHIKLYSIKYTSSLIDLLLMSDDYYEPIDVYIKILKHADNLQDIHILQTYVSVLRAKNMAAISSRLKELCDSVEKNTKFSQNTVELLVLIAKTLPVYTKTESMWSTASAEYLLVLMSQIIKNIRAYESTQASVPIQDLCKECTNVKRHVSYKLITCMENVLQILGKKQQLSSNILEKYTKILEYILNTVLQGLKCSSRLTYFRRIVTFIYNMVVSWNFFGEYY